MENVDSVGSFPAQLMRCCTKDIEYIYLGLKDGTRIAPSITYMHVRINGRSLAQQYICFRGVKA